MKLRREIDTIKATYEITELTDEHFRFIHAACLTYLHQKQVNPTEKPFDSWYEVVNKLEKMKESSVTIIN